MISTLDALIKNAQEYNPKLKEDLIRRAYAYADAALVGKKLLNGETLLSHALATARHLTEIRVDSFTIAAALLHDVLKESDLTREDLEEEFGETVARLVDGVSAIKKMKTSAGRDYPVENLRKLLLATAQDVRVVLIRLAEKLHNLQTLEGLPAELRRETIRKAFEVYAPLADRIGVFHFKWQIEDLAFKHSQPECYAQIKDYLKKERMEREKIIAQTSRKLKEVLAKNKVEAKVFGRVKHYYSIYKKWQTPKYARLELEEFVRRLHDKLAFMVLVKETADCYLALGIIHQHWRHHPELFDDYIANPKPNGYRSLQTAIFLGGGEISEVQIKTHAMHEYNEFGPASHLFYKEVGREKGSRVKAPEERIAWLKNLVEWQEEILEEKEFEEALKIDVFGDRVFVFTPKGEVKDLPAGSTPIDFAYSVHSEVGNNATGAKVDGKLVPLDYKLQNGQVVEILTSKRRKLPSLDWLEFVRSRHARYQIRKALRGTEEDLSE